MNNLKDTILSKIEEIISDERYPQTPDKDANVFVNAPLALIQMGMKGKVHAYNDVLKILEDE